MGVYCLSASPRYVDDMDTFVFIQRTFYTMTAAEFQSHAADHYRDISRLAMLAGTNMARFGAEAYRVEDTTVRLLRTTGLSYAEAHVSVTGLMITLDDPSLPQPISLTKRIDRRVSDLSRISRTNDISRRFVAGELSIPEAEKALNEIADSFYYTPVIQILAYALVAGFFTFMFGGHPADAAASALVGLLTGLFSKVSEKLALPAFIRTFLSSVVLGLCLVLFLSILPLGTHAAPVITGSIMPLVPGMLLTVGIRDLLNGDYLSGLSRLVEASLIALAIASGLSIVIFTAEKYLGTYDLTTPRTFFTFGQSWLLPPELFFQGLCSFVSGIAFVVLFDAEPRHLVWCGLTAGLTWFVFCVCRSFGFDSALSTFLGSLTAALLSFYLAVRVKTPVTVFFTGGIFCLVPGAGIFQSMYSFLSGDTIGGLQTLFLTLETAGLIAIALVVQTALHRILHSSKKGPIRI